MRIIKLKAKHYKDCYELLVDAGVKDEEGHDPSRVYVSKSDLRTMKENLMIRAKKEKPWANRRYIDLMVGFDWLNFSPNSQLQDILKPGYALILDK